MIELKRNWTWSKQQTSITFSGKKASFVCVADVINYPKSSYPGQGKNLTKFSNQICKNAEKRNSIVNVLLEKFHLDTDLHHMKSLHRSLSKQKSYHTVTVNSPYPKLVFPSWLILGSCHNFCSVRWKGQLSVIWHKPPAQYIAQTA